MANNIQPSINCAGTSGNRFNHEWTGNPDNFCYVCSIYIGKKTKEKLQKT